MNHMESIQNQIEITRQLIIGQLKDEISHFQAELQKLTCTDGSERKLCGQRIYTNIIARKRQLLAALS